jgi:hypothetical protein
MRRKKFSFLRPGENHNRQPQKKSIMTTSLEATAKDFEQMMQMLTGFFVTQIAGAVATYSIADHLAKGPATAGQIANIEGINSSAAFRLLRACASLGWVSCDDAPRSSDRQECKSHTVCFQNLGKRS